MLKVNDQPTVKKFYTKNISEVRSLKFRKICNLPVWTLVSQIVPFKVEELF